MINLNVRPKAGPRPVRSRAGAGPGPAGLAGHGGGRAFRPASYREFSRLAADPRTGVVMRPAVFYFRHLVDDHPAELAKMRELAEHVPGFVHDPALISHHGVSPQAGVVDAYSHLARWSTPIATWPGCKPRP